MDKFRLKLFFHELLELSYNDLRTGWGNPCSHLLEKMCVQQDPWLDSIVGDYSNDSHEFRLNNAGLKLYWQMRRTNNSPGEERTFRCYISGDQAKEYPFFVAQAGKLILKYQFNNRPRFRDLK
jgi:hypothetical protein